jgi:MraZ protein
MDGGSGWQPRTASSFVETPTQTESEAEQVVEVFRGEGDQKVDPKGRVSIPALFRRVIERGDPDWADGQRANLVIVYGTAAQKRLDCYTMKGIARIDRRIAKMKKGSDERKALERIYQGHAHPTQLDDEGRITLPLKLREKLDLGDRAFFIAAGDHFQLWRPDTYAGSEAARVDDWLAAQGDDFDPDTLMPDLDDDEE